MNSEPTMQADKSKTAEQSYTNLTKPTLYSIYDEDITKSASNDLYNYLTTPSGASPSSENINIKEQLPHSHKRYDTGFRCILNSVILFVFGIAYHAVSLELYDNHDLSGNITSQPLYIGAKVSKLISGGIFPPWFTYGLEGIILGSILPLTDSYFDLKPQLKKANLLSIIKNVNVLLGVTYGIRKLEWSSSLQASGAWFLLNIILWLFFDGTLSMLFVCTLIASSSSYLCYLMLHFDNGVLLYIADFYFLGNLLFGQLGRYLFNL